MNPIVYIGLKNSDGCVCGSNEGWLGWGTGNQEYINPRMERNVLYITAIIGDKIENRSKRLDCFHVDRPDEYDSVNLTLKFKNGEERQYDLTKREQLTDCLKMMEEYTLYGNELEPPSKFEVANEIEFMDI